MRQMLGNGIYLGLVEFGGKKVGVLMFFSEEKLWEIKSVWLKSSFDY